MDAKHPHCAFTSTGVRNSPAAQQRLSQFMGARMTVMPHKPKRKQNNSRSSSNVQMFLGSEGLLGVGAPEVAVTLLVGYFILGPQDLYKLVKEIGKTFNTLKTFSADATKQFEETMEDTIQMEDFKKAQRELRELNDAFSFRRSINVDNDSEPFLNEKVQGYVDPGSGVVSEVDTLKVEEGAAAAAGVATAATATAEPPKKKKKIKRRIKKKVAPQPEPTPADDSYDGNKINNGNVKDLDMSDAFSSPEEQAKWEAEMDEIQRSRRERLDKSGAADWFTASDEMVADKVLAQQPKSEQPYDMGTMPDYDAEMRVADEQTRFAQQLSGNWNEQILSNEDKLSPLSKIMERLAILEEEKNAANLRLEEEFRLRGELEEKFYKQKRNILEEAAAEVQADAYISMGPDATSSPTEPTTAEEKVSTQVLTTAEKKASSPELTTTENKAKE